MTSFDESRMREQFTDVSSDGARSFSTSFGKVTGLEGEGIPLGDSEKDRYVRAKGLDEAGSGETSEEHK